MTQSGPRSIGGLLRRAGVLLDDETPKRDAGRRRPTNAFGGDAGFEFLPGGIVPHVNLVHRLVEVPLPWPDVGEAAHVLQRHIVEEEVLRIAAPWGILPTDTIGHGARATSLLLADRQSPSRNPIARLSSAASRPTARSPALRRTYLRISGRSTASDERPTSG